MARQQTNTNLGTGNINVASGRTGVTFERGQQFDARDNSWGQLASALKQVNPALEPFARREALQQDSAATDMGANLKQNKEAMANLVAGNDALLQLQKDGHLNNRTIPLAERSYRLAYAKNQASLYNQALAARMDEATLVSGERVDTETLIGETYEQYTDLFMDEPEAFAMFNESVTAIDHRFRDVSTSTNIKNDRIVGETRIAGNLSDTLELALTTDNPDALVDLQSTYNDLSATQLGPDKGPWYLENVVGPKVGMYLSGDDKNLDKARAVIELASGVTNGNGVSLGKGGKTGEYLAKLEDKIVAEEAAESRRIHFAVSNASTMRRNDIKKTVAEQVEGPDSEAWLAMSDEEDQAYALETKPDDVIWRVDYLAAKKAMKKAKEVDTPAGYASALEQQMARGLITYADIENDPKLDTVSHQRLKKYDQFITDAEELVDDSFGNGIADSFAHQKDDLTYEVNYEGESASDFSSMTTSKQKGVLALQNEHAMRYMRDAMIEDLRQTGDVTASMKNRAAIRHTYQTGPMKPYFDSIVNEASTKDVKQQRLWTLRKESIDAQFATRLRRANQNLPATHPDREVEIFDGAEKFFNSLRGVEQESFKAVTAEKKALMDAYVQAKVSSGYTADEINSSITDQGVKFDVKDINFRATPVFTSLEELYKEYNKGNYEDSGLFNILGKKLGAKSHTEFFQAQEALLINK